MAAVRANPSVDLVTDDRMGFKVGPRGRVSLRHRFPSREAWGIGGVEPLKIRGWVLDKRQVDPLVRRSLVIESGARFPENLSSSEDQAFCMQLVFAAQGCRAIRVAEPLYYYRLGWATRPEDQDLNFLRAVRIAVEQTGSAELDRLVGPAITGEFALRRRDSAMRARVGRLVDADSAARGARAIADAPPAPSRWVTLRALWFRRSIVVLSIFAGRHVRPGVADDITRQLQDEDIDLRATGGVGRRLSARIFRG